MGDEVRKMKRLNLYIKKIMSDISNINMKNPSKTMIKTNPKNKKVFNITNTLFI